MRCTKRKMLSATNSLHDPLRFVIPAVLKAMLLYSKACNRKNSWVEPIAGSIQSKWKAWINGLPSLVKVQIKRWYNCTTPFLLYFFSDASSLARAVVLKLRVATPRCVVSIFQRRRGIFRFCAIKSRFYCVKRTLIVDSFLTFF